ncbi:MAG: hypothetical protein M0036_17500 [Desulfobacteraceae bacterium]|nr:hypothetical protein [Desulfobacteraceae bacterium]
MFEPRCIAPENRLNTRQRVVVLIMNLLLLGELTWAMYYCQLDPENLTAVFLRTFVPMAAGTLVAARYLVRKLQNAPARQPGVEA